MSKLVTAEQCVAAIQADVAWRKKEITTLKQRVLDSEGETRSVLMRAGILVIYAHWEGFVKSSSNFYLLHINERIKRYAAQPNDHYKNIIMWRSIQQRGTFPHTKSPLGFLDALKHWKETPESLLPDGLIDTEANLDFDVLQKILRTIDIPCDDFVSKKNMIDEKILGRRNPIAHGERRSLTFKDYQEADDEVRELIDTFQGKLLDCIQRSTFLQNAR